ncbi:hypothetical protein Cylst_6644 (plasmid) [Cylindrospermum stagnale PCC 7417]|uniref:DUF4277 domain-containing protein n=1 Tax=Cylindrospermum stagnale PCC 7417 TaxID=56107 RepID=K9X840_9NOST|nr:hypothetical protein Cylst_6453 [Cylindrospermum stagnale PCC 7417]AFZ28411.1 hypothetical protein Cylst_6644 [Cylindrospermum stagnale PCC 7417]
MNGQQEEVKIKNLDHLGIVAGIIDDIAFPGLVRYIFEPKSFN